MSLIEIKWNPSRKELRSFGIIAIIATAVISLLLHLIKGLAIQWTLLIFAIGLVIFLSSIISTKVTRIFYVALTMLTMPIGYVVSFVLLGTFYFLIITPLAFVFRLIGRDRLHRRFEPDAKSYWMTRHSASTLDRYFRQF